MGGLTLRQSGHKRGQGPTVKALSAVDVNEQLNVRLAVDNKRENSAGRLPQSPACLAMLACCTRLVRTLLAGSAFSTGGVTHGART